MCFLHYLWWNCLLPNMLHQNQFKIKAHGEKVFILYNSLSVIKNKLKRNNTFIVVNMLICWWFKADVVSFFMCVASFANEQAWWITDAYQSIWKVSIKLCINEISFYIHFFCEFGLPYIHKILRCARSTNSRYCKF